MDAGGASRRVAGAGAPAAAAADGEAAPGRLAAQGAPQPVIVLWCHPHRQATNSSLMYSSAPHTCRFQCPRFHNVIFVGYEFLPSFAQLSPRCTKQSALRRAQCPSCLVHSIKLHGNEQSFSSVQAR